MFGRKKREALEKRIAALENKVYYIEQQLREAYAYATQANAASKFTIGLGVLAETFQVGPVLLELMRHLKVYPYSISASPARIGVEDNDV